MPELALVFSETEVRLLAGDLENYIAEEGIKDIENFLKDEYESMLDEYKADYMIFYWKGREYEVNTADDFVYLLRAFGYFD